jgi:hypothetical protein
MLPPSLENSIFTIVTHCADVRNGFGKNAWLNNVVAVGV